MAKIYVASSWRNEYQQEVVKVLRELGTKFMTSRIQKGEQVSSGPQ